MPPVMMAGLQTGITIYAENTVATTSHYNPYFASISTINNLNQISSLPEGLSYIPQATPTLNTTSLMLMRQQMNESNHTMGNMLTQQIGMIDLKLQLEL